MIKENLENVQNKITEACKRAGRLTSEVTLISVSKTKPVSMLAEAYDAGVREFGENKVQEIIEKYDKLPSDVNWHMIGHLQRNKVKYIIDKTKLIHSVDSVRLAEQISKEAVKNNLNIDILLEVNVANEDSKYGFRVDELYEQIEKIAALPGITIQGLMTIAPFVENSEDNRWVFRELKKISVDIADKNIDNVFMRELSMGMTGDYEVAIEEGATFVRVGTGIFGERNYNI